MYVCISPLMNAPIYTVQLQNSDIKHPTLFKLVVRGILRGVILQTFLKCKEPEGPSSIVWEEKEKHIDKGIHCSQ